MREFEDVVGGQRVRQVGDGGVDGVRPALRVCPASEKEVAEVMALAHRRRWAVMPVGGATHLGIGMAPRPFDVWLDLAGLDQAIDHQAADLVATVDAGVRWSRAAEVLGLANQMIPVDVRYPERATAGGVVAANASGPRRHAYGTVRDWVVGLRVVTPDGTIVRTGGQVVKNVAGYDMNKLYIGSFGTLGIITAVTFKLAPRPPERARIALAVSSPGAAVAAYRRMVEAGAVFTAAEVLSPAAAVEDGRRGWQLVAEVAGSARQIDELAGRATGALADGSEHDGITVDHGDAVGWPGGTVVVKGTARPQQIHQWLQSEAGPIETDGIWVSAGLETGVMRAGLTVPQAGSVIAAWRRRLEADGGALVLEEAPVAIKRDVGVWGTPQPSWRVMRRIKEAFDPLGVLAGGRFVDGI